MKNKFWDIDLPYGQLVEGRIKDILTKPAVEPDHIQFEIKSDRQAHKTGNTYIEFECWGEKTGPKYSLSDWWVIEFAGHQGPETAVNVMAFFERKWFLQRMKFLWEKGRMYEVQGGDEMASRGGLVKIEDLFTDRWIQ